jgi:hypothetical protein
LYSEHFYHAFKTYRKIFIKNQNLLILTYMPKTNNSFTNYFRKLKYSSVLMTKRRTSSDQVKKLDLLQEISTIYKS